MQQHEDDAARPAGKILVQYIGDGISHAGSRIFDCMYIICIFEGDAARPEGKVLQVHLTAYI